jgi:hypothetical protein
MLYNEHLVNLQMAQLIITRISQHDLSIREFSVYVNGVSVRGLHIGENFIVPIDSNRLSVQVKCWPYSSDVLTVDASKVDYDLTLYVGLFYTGLLGGFRRNALKLVSPERYMELTKPIGIKLSRQYYLAIVSSCLLSGIGMIVIPFLSLHPKEIGEISFILGLVAIVGLKMNASKKNGNDSFVFNMLPFSNALSLLVIYVMIWPNEGVLGAFLLVGSLLMITIGTLSMQNRRKVEKLNPPR